MFENVNLWIMTLVVFYGVIVTYFGSKFYVKILEKTLLEKKTIPLFSSFFMFIIPVLLFPPVLIGISYWLIAMASSMITLVFCFIIFKKKHRKEFYK
jgi:hypothetical protein